jgi:hypothetical protein
MRLPDRWIPVVAATVGVLGGMVGALVGGYISNQGQEQQFENQREAAKDDLRQGAYANFVQEGVSYVLQVQLQAQGRPVTKEELDARRDALTGALGAVFLFGDNELARCADLLLNDLLGKKPVKALNRLLAFTAKAKVDLHITKAKEDVDIPVCE